MIDHLPDKEAKEKEVRNMMLKFHHILSANETFLKAREETDEEEEPEISAVPSTREKTMKLPRIAAIVESPATDTDVTDADTIIAQYSRKIQQHPQVKSRYILNVTVPSISFFRNRHENLPLRNERKSESKVTFQMNMKLT